MGHVARWVVIAAMASGVAAPVVACGGNGAAPSAPTSSGGVVNTAGSAGSPSGGAGGTSLAGAGGAGTGAPSDCRELGPLGAARSLYPLPTGASLQSLDPDGEGLLLSVGLGDDLLRVVALQPDGSTSELLAETEYTRRWSFAPVRVIATRASGVLDLLVSDEASLELVRKDGAGVAWFDLASTNHMDLEAQALAPVGAKRVAGFSRGADTSALALVDLDAVTAKKTKGADLSTAVSQWIKNAGSSRDFVAPAAFNAAPSPTGLWLTAERLAPATECTAVGSGGASDAGTRTGSYDCQWHVDVWHIADAPTLGPPTATVDAKTLITPPNGDATLLGLNHADRAFSRYQLSRDHAIAVDPTTSRLALAINEYLGGRSWDIRILLLEPSGQRVLDVTIPSDRPSDWVSWWLYTRSDRVWLCHGIKCAVVDATGTLEFTTTNPPFTVQGVMAQPDGLMLVGDEPNTAVLGAALPCRRP